MIRQKILWVLIFGLSFVPAARADVEYQIAESSAEDQAEPQENEPGLSAEASGEEEDESASPAQVGRAPASANPDTTSPNPSSAARTPPTYTDGLSLDGRVIMRNGAPFDVRGVIFEGFLEPVHQLQACISEDFCKRHLETRDYFWGNGKYADGKDALTLAVEHWDINTVRFNVNQSALDRQSPNYSREYVREIQKIVRHARDQFNLIVFVALFDGRNTNGPESLLNLNPKTPLDNHTTLRAGKELGRLFGDDPGVVIETLNEPYGGTWTKWRDGDGRELVGVNKVIEAIRSVGAKNLIGLQGLGARFADFPGGIEDPLEKIVYSVHPFPADGSDERVNWFLNFGFHANKYPSLITAWGAYTHDGWCDVRGPGMVNQFLSYLKQKKMGLILYAIDVPWTIIRDYRETGIAPRPFDATCGDKGSAGAVLKNYFNGQPLAPVTNTAPTIAKVEGPDVVYLGEPATFKVVASDAERDPINYRAWWGDGSSMVKEDDDDQNPFQTSNTFTHTYNRQALVGKEVTIGFVTRDSTEARTTVQKKVKILRR